MQSLVRSGEESFICIYNGDGINSVSHVPLSVKGNGFLGCLMIAVDVKVRLRPQRWKALLESRLRIAIEHSCCGVIKKHTQNYYKENEK